MHKIVGSLFQGSTTATLGTALTRFIEPWRGKLGSPPLAYRVQNGRPNWTSSGIYTHISEIIYAAGTTAHDVVLMRPLNWAQVATAVAHNATGVTLLTDPGAYSTAYKYGLPTDASGLVSGVANNAIAASDYVAVQLKDGTWHLSTVASVSSLTLTLTTATPNVTGGGIAAGAILFFFGVAGDSNPQTGRAHEKITSVASTRTKLFDSAGMGTFAALNPGDPLLLYSSNATAAAVWHSTTGFFAQAG